MTQPESSNPTDFIRDIINDDLQTNKNDGRVATRFPPEPNGYIHIGHAKSVCLNFGIAAQYQGTCNLRMDDTDPLGESMEYVESIIRDVRWLGFNWKDRLFYASDYFEKIYQLLINKNLNYEKDELFFCRFSFPLNVFVLSANSSCSFID